MFKHHNDKLIKFLYVNGQRNLLSRPCQATLGFSIVPYETKFWESEILPLALIQLKEWPSIESFF